MEASCDRRGWLQCPLLGGPQADTPQAMLSDIMCLPHIHLPALTNNDDNNVDAFRLMTSWVCAGQVIPHKP